MGVEPFLVASTLNLVIAQRLVRKVCPHCAISFKLDKEQIKTLEKKIDADTLKALLEKDHSISPKLEGVHSLEDITFRKGKGCDRCAQSGYKGRIGIFEVLEVDDEISKMITQEKSAVEIEEKVRSKGMRKIFEDGFLKAALGITTIEEILRVSDEQ